MIFMNVAENTLTELPTEIGYLTGLTALDGRGCTA